MMIAAAVVKIQLAFGYTDMRKGLDGLAALVQERLKKDPFSGHLLPSEARRRHAQNPVLGRQWALPVQQVARSRRLHLAENERSRPHGDAVPGAARHADRRHRLAHTGASMAPSIAARFATNQHKT